MIVAEKEIARVVSICADIRHRYSECAPDADMRPISMNVLTYVIGEYSSRDIDFYVTKWPAEHLLGSVKVWSDRAEVDIPYELNKCYRRFVGCKELCHLVIDDESAHTKDVAHLIKTFTQPLYMPVNELTNGGATVSEVLAVYAAMELLFPFEERGAEKEKIARDEQKYWDVADYYKIPEAYTEFFLSHIVMELLTDIHDKISEIS